MKFDVPPLIHTKPTLGQWKAIYPGEGMKAKFAYKVAVRVYWKTVLSESQNHKCCWCGILMTEEPGYKHSATIEHVVPRSEGGANHPDNYAVACSKCNQARGTQTIQEFLSKVRLRQGTRKHSEAEFSNNSKNSLVKELAKKGITVNPKTKPCRVKRKFDLALAAEAVRNGGPNPFEVDTRSWKTFERYATSDSFLNTLRV